MVLKDEEQLGFVAEIVLIELCEHQVGEELGRQAESENKLRDASGVVVDFFDGAFGPGSGVELVDQLQRLEVVDMDFKLAQELGREQLLTPGCFGRQQVGKVEGREVAEAEGCVVHAERGSQS